MPNQDIILQTAQTYDKIAADYANRWCDFSLDEQLDAFTNYVKPGGLILDLGCGPGRDMHDFKKRGYPVIGLDRSAGMLKEAAKRNVGPLVQADMCRPPFARHSFKGVWASASMLHLPRSDFSLVLREIYHLLNHGHVFLAVKEGTAEKWCDDGEHGRRFFAYYHPAEVELALERANFHVLWFKVNADSRSRNYDWINAIGWTRLETVKTGANAIMFNEAGQVLLTRRADNGKWCVPE